LRHAQATDNWSEPTDAPEHIAMRYRLAFVAVVVWVSEQVGGMRAVFTIGAVAHNSLDSGVRRSRKPVRERTVPMCRF
jgi:hypothetical protein